MTKVLFVCKGNICRSPIAEGIAKSIAQKENIDLTIDSAGTTWRYEGEAPCPDSVKVAQLHDIDISKLRARRVSPLDQTAFDHIIALDSKVKEKLEILGFCNVELLGNFADYTGANIPDPYFFNVYDAERMEEVFTMIEACVKDFIAQKYQ